MDIHPNIPLKNYLTMKLGGKAAFLTEVRTDDEIVESCDYATTHNLPIFVLGGGSNVIARDEGFAGLVIRIRKPGFEVIADDASSTTVRIGAGEPWDSVVKKTINMGLSGIEAMSGIPGTAGATPVQNVGAYGQEIADTLQSLTAYDTATKKFVELSNTDCGFTYRHSIFRGTAIGRYIISSITLKLSKHPLQPPFYDSLQKYIDSHNIKIYAPNIIRDAVLEIRQTKLPDWRTMPSCGSFFKNAIVEKWQIDDLKKLDPNMPMFAMGEKHYKIPTGYLLDHSGLRGQLLHGIRVYDKNALILINESATSYADLAAARNDIIGRIRDTYHIMIEQEPLEIE